MKEKIKGKIIEIFKILISPILVVVANAIRGYQSVLFRVAKDINLNPIVFTTNKIFFKMSKTLKNVKKAINKTMDRTSI